MAVVNSEEVEFQTHQKKVMAHAALCGLEHRQQARLLIGPPEGYVHGHTLPIMLTQIMFPSGGWPAAPLGLVLPAPEGGNAPLFRGGGLQV